MVGYNGAFYWIDYDEVGNPTRYGYGLSDSDYMEYGCELTWDGRELVAFRSSDDFESLTYYSEITYTYNADGIRTSKTVNGIKHEYYLSGSQILAEIWTENNVEHMLIYIYDESGAPIALRYRNDSYAYDQFDTFFFEKNLQGDIIAIYNELGEKIGSYLYDAWGNHTAKTVSGNTTLENKVVNTYNPFRYRGYYYDVETKFYYLQSRYYNPEWCRFLNADDAALLGANGDLQAFNLYAYCSNNPILLVDPDGEFALFAIVVGAVVGAVVNATATVISNVATGEEWNDGLGRALATGALSGGLAATGLGPAAQIIGNALISGADNIISQGKENGYDNIDWGETLFVATVDGLMSANAGISKGAAKHFDTMERQARKSIKNTFSKQGIASGSRQIKKAGKHYFSQTKSLLFDTFVKDSWKDFLKTAGSNTAKSAIVG